MMTDSDNRLEYMITPVSTFGADDYESGIGDPVQLCLSQAGMVIGTADLELRPDTRMVEEVHLRWIEVSADQQQQGYGRALLAEIARSWPGALLTTSGTTDAGQALLDQSAVPVLVTDDH